MRLKFYLLLIAVMCCSAVSLFGQKPGVKWQNDLIPVDALFDIKHTKDNGFFIGGSDKALLNYGFMAYDKNSQGVACVSKTDSLGFMKWKANFGPEGYAFSSITSVEETIDGGCIAAGYLNSVDTSEFFIAKLSVTGQVQWEKSIGGNYADRANSIALTNDNGYLIVGTTLSEDRDVTGFHGTAGGWNNADVWIVKLDENGTVLWKKCYGGVADDKGESVIKTRDNGFIIAGTSSSVDGNLSSNYGQHDGWVFKIDAAGNLLWQKNYGDTGEDFFKSIDATPDGNFIIAGYTNSNNGEVTGNHGYNDVWVVKINENGDLLWSKCFGGSYYDYGLSAKRTFSNNTLIGAYSGSSDGNVTGHIGANDLWVLMLSDQGEIVWEKNTGTVKNDYMGAVAFLSDNNFVVAAWGDSIQYETNRYIDGRIIGLGNASIIKGALFKDSNLNGTKDSNESFYSDAVVKTEKNGTTKSSIPYNGDFSVNVDTGIYISSVILSTPYYTVVPSTITSDFTSYFQTDSISFALQPIPGLKDLSIHLIPTTVARPGFDVQYQITYTNQGTEAISSGAVKLVKDPNLVIQSIIPINNTLVNDTITWDFTDMNPGETRSIFLFFKVNPPPSVNNGSALKLEASILPIADDIAPLDDTSRLNQIVIGSYDPNDKTESHGGTITEDEINLGGYLNYTIRFQNTGTDTAFNVMVRDTLSSQVNWNTLQMVSASHAYNLQISDQNKLVWSFNNIKLVDSNRSEPASHGYISYRIKPKSTLAANDVVPNAAGIYFDYNLPVQTNTVTTLVVQAVVLPIRLAAFTAQLTQQGNVTISWKTSFEQNSDHYEVERSKDGVHFEKLGTVKSKNLSTGANYSLNDPTPLDGANYYRLRSVDKDGSFTYSAIELVNTNKGAAILASLYPNPSGGDVTLKLAGKVKGKISFSVSDLSGAKVYQKDLGYLSTERFTIPLNISRFARGTYVVQFVVDEQVFTQKLIIQ